MNYLYNKNKLGNGFSEEQLEKIASCDTWLVNGSKEHENIRIINYVKDLDTKASLADLLKYNLEIAKSLNESFKNNGRILNIIICDTAREASGFIKRQRSNNGEEVKEDEASKDEVGGGPASHDLERRGLNGIAKSRSISV